MNRGDCLGFRKVYKFLTPPPRQAKRRPHRAATGKRGNQYRPLIGIAFVHTVIDDHSRMAYAEIRADEKAATVIEVLQHAAARFVDHGVTIERVLSDNGSAYRPHAWREACDELRITPKRTRPYRPQTNGKIERFHRTLADGWAYAPLLPIDPEHRNQALPDWLHFYNHCGSSGGWSGTGRPE